MTSIRDEFAELHDLVNQRYQAALETSASVEPATGESVEGDAVVTIDERGVIAAVEFGDRFAELTPDELRAEFLGALQAAREAQRGTAPNLEQATAALHDRTIADRYVELFERAVAEGDQRRDG